MEKTDIRSAFERIREDESLCARRADMPDRHFYYRRGDVLYVFKTDGSDFFRYPGVYSEGLFNEYHILSDWEVCKITDL